MKKRRVEPIELCDLLPRLAREAGAERLRRSAMLGLVRRALGDWLGRRLLGCRREGAVIELEFAGEVAARQAEALEGELLRSLGRTWPGDAPRRLRVLTGPEAQPPPMSSRRAAEGPAPAPAPGPEVAKALEGVDDARTRAQWARIAGRGTAGLA